MDKIISRKPVIKPCALFLLFVWSLFLHVGKTDLRIRCQSEDELKYQAVQQSRSHLVSVCTSLPLRCLQSKTFQLLFTIRSSVWEWETGPNSFVMHLNQLVSSDVHVKWMISFSPIAFSVEGMTSGKSCREEMEKCSDLSKKHLLNYCLCLWTLWILPFNVCTVVVSV